MDDVTQGPTTRVGFLGLGAMGLGMAGRLLDRGFPVVVHNRTRAKAEPLQERGAVIAGSAAEAVSGADVVLISLATSQAVEDTLFGTDNAIAELAPGAVVADMSTVAPDSARQQAKRVTAAGGRALDACVLGNAQHAKDGELRFMIGGRSGDVDAVRPVVDVLAKQVVHLGDHGKGATAKLAMNLLMGVQMQALSEAVVLGERAGLPREQLLSMIAESGYSSPVMRFKASVMGRRAFERADFRLDLMRKDLLLALDEAAGLSVPMATTSAAYEVLTSASNRGLGEYDCAAVLAEVERAGGVDGYPWPGAEPHA